MRLQSMRSPAEEALEEMAEAEGDWDYGEGEGGLDRRRRNLGRKRTVQVLRRKKQLGRVASSVCQPV